MKALIFDFDGLILDTETTAFEAWRRVYADHGVELPREDWVQDIGTSGVFDPLAHLQEATAGRLDVESLQTERRRVRDTLVDALAPRPGVVAWLEEARACELRIAVASSSPLTWVDGHLERIGLRPHFAEVVTADQVERVKPDPALYRRALSLLDVGPDEAIAVEDSPNGVTAARAAGLPCVAVPGPMTRDGDFRGASLRLESLADRSLSEVVAALFGTAI